MKIQKLTVILIAALLIAACTSSGGSSGSYPVGTFSQGILDGTSSPNTPPPGANIGCIPTASHPYPVILVHGTFENESLNWQALSPTLANAGFCVYTFNYGATLSSLNTFDGLNYIEDSAQELATEVNNVLSSTGASQVDIVGHSQGGMMPRYYIDFLGGASKVNTLVGLAPSNHGTTLNGLATLASNLTNAGFNVNSIMTSTLDAPSLVEQEAGSTFLANLNANGDTVPGPKYVVIETTDDEVVTPYSSAFLTGSNVTNITIQNQCSADTVGHIGIAYDQVALGDVLNVLGPNNPSYQPSCDSSGFGPGI
jgi:triacylglycerol esterase/lipase EstA (alpha/beta hydrolase family)